jgi:hypothetical protein
MLWFERQVVDSLISPSLDDGAREVIANYVDDTLRAMPEHLRFGVFAESIAFGAQPWVEHRLGRFSPASMPRRIERMRTSRIDVVRQYVRLLEGLVLFAENELVPDAA